MRKVIAALLLTASLSFAQIVVPPPTNQWKAWSSAATLHSLGFDVDFIEGNKWTGSAVAQWFCLWACVPYIPTPARLEDWPGGRFKYTGVAKVALPNQPEGCANAGPEAIMGDGTVQFRCLDGRRFIPAVGDVGRFLAGVDPAKAGKVNGK